MNFNQLKYILAVNQFRNFARAAEDCDVAQSTLSREIQRLEKEFEIVIFDRTRQPVVPTMKGLDILKSATAILEEYHHFVTIAEKKDNLPSGEFHLGIIPSLAPYLLPLFTIRLAQKYPNLQLKITEAGEKEIEAGFRNESMDAALSIAPFYKNGFYEDALFEEQFVLYLNSKHPLAKLSVVDWKDIPVNDLILQDEIKTFLLDQKTLPANTLQTSPSLQNVAYENGSLETIRKIIDVNGGITILPHLSTIYMGQRRLKMIRVIRHPTPKRTIIMVTPRGFEKNRIIKAVRQEILAGLPTTKVL